MRDRYGDRPQPTGCCSSASPTFDTFGEEVYPCLASGATLVVPTGARGRAARLPRHRGRALTHRAGPAHLLLARAGADPTAVAWPPGLRLLILGGEQVRADAAGPLVRHGRRPSGGPQHLRARPRRPSSRPPPGSPRPTRRAARRSGTPIGDTCAARDRPSGGARCPTACAGELVIGGAGVAEGYLGQPELTAERFARVARVTALPHRRPGPPPARRPRRVPRAGSTTSSRSGAPGRAGRGGGGAHRAPGDPARGRRPPTATGRLVAHLVPAAGRHRARPRGAARLPG